MRRIQIAGVVALKRTATPAIPTFQPLKRLCRSGCSSGDRLDLSQPYLVSQPCTSTDSVFHPSYGSFQAEYRAERREPVGEPSAGGLARMFPNTCLSADDTAQRG